MFGSFDGVTHKFSSVRAFSHTEQRSFTRCVERTAKNVQMFLCESVFPLGAEIIYTLR